MARLLHTPTGVSDFAPAAAAKAMLASDGTSTKPESAKAAPQPATDAAAAGWTIGTAAAVCRRATACTPPEHAPACMDFALAPPAASCAAAQAFPSAQALITLDLELTADEAIGLVQALAAPATDAIPAPRPVAAALQAARSLPQRLHRTAISLGMAGRRVVRAASSGARRLHSTLAAATCMSPRSSAAAAEPFAHVN